MYYYVAFFYDICVGLRLGMRRLRWVADGGASEAEPRALHGAERLVVVRGEAELLGVGPRLDVFPRLCEIKILRRVRAEFRAPDTLIDFHTLRAQLEQHQA